MLRSFVYKFGTFEESIDMKSGGLGFGEGYALNVAYIEYTRSPV